MNKIIFIFIFSFYCYSSLAQSVGHGLKIGFSRVGNAEHEFEMIKNKSFKREPLGFGGLAAGMFINQKVSENFWVKHEVLYVNKGFGYQDTLLNGSIKNLKVRLHYLEIYPLSLALNIKGFQLFTGPVIGFHLGKRAQYLNNKDEIEVEKDSDYDESDRNLIEGGFVVGVEYESKPGINLGVRFTQCLISSKHPANDNISCSNHAIVFIIGYTLIKKKEESKYEEE